jgi:hypothetical protein
MSFKFNPITGMFDMTRGVDSSSNTIEFAEKVAAEFDCDAGVAVGDLVVPSNTVSDTVEKITVNSYDGLVIGIVIRKISSTRCEVLASGKISGLTGIDFGKPLFVGTNGKLTTAKPVTGHLQAMGMSLTTTTGFLLPSMMKVIQS